MSWSDPCSKCGEHRADCECTTDTKKEINVSKIKTLADEFIPYEEALVLKELGFNEKCLGFFDRLKLIADCYCVNNNSDWVNENNRISAPLYQQAFGWFREKHNLDYAIRPIQKKGEYNFIIIDSELLYHQIDCIFDIYEEAELACLRKLIEIVKKLNHEENR